MSYRSEHKVTEGSDGPGRTLGQLRPDVRTPEKKGREGLWGRPVKMKERETILADFLNHGILPFVGRCEELDEIREFIAGTIDATSLRSILITGEAGIGKSRLVEEMIRRSGTDGEVTVHARLRPASSTSPVSLLAHALHDSPSARPLLRRRLKASLEEVVEAVRRLCRLRPTLVVLEDIHLLEGDTLHDFAGLLTALSDDPVSLLCSSRPDNDAPSALLEASLTRRIRLEGLREEDIDLLSRQLFGDPADGTAARSLAEATLGNPLAIRGGLRGALRQDAIRREDNGCWRPDHRFDEIVRRGAGSISEGLAASLTPEERVAADRLACLGEIFSYEGARILLGEETDGMIGHLLFKGILVRPIAAAASLPGTQPSRKPLLAFTHTLVHHRLLAEADVPAERLLLILLNREPLYAITPYEALASCGAGCASLVRPRLHELTGESIRTASVLESSSEWKLALRLIEALLAVTRASGAEGPERLGNELPLLDAYLLVSRELHGREFDQVLRTYRKTAAASLDFESRSHLLKGLVHKYRRVVYTDHAGGDPDRLEEKIAALTAEHPGLLRTEGYIRFLEWKTERAALLGDWETHAEIEAKLEGLAEMSDLPEELHNDLHRQLRTNFLPLVRTPEEYRKRLRLIEEADGNREGLSETSWLLQKARFYGLTGHFKRQAEIYREAESLARKRGRNDVARSLAESAVKCRVALGLPPEEAEERLLRINALATDENGRSTDPIVVNNLTAVALLSGSVFWALSFYDRYFPKTTNPTILPHLLALRRKDRAGSWRKTDPHPALAGVFEPILRLLLHEETDKDRILLRNFIGEITATEPIATRHILFLEIALRLLEVGEDRIPEGDSLLREGVGKALAWSSERELWTFMDTILSRFGDRLQPQERKKNEAVAEAIRNATLSLATTEGSPKEKELSLSMFGTIEGSTGMSEPPIRPRGERLRTLLGVMAANELLSRPLDREEFLRIASGQNEAARQARDVVNKTVSRLRESFGNSDFILTDEETPRLNRALVEVDILEVKQKLRSAEESLRRGNLARAVADIRSGLGLWGGAVPFPALYDEFFETLRDEFETEVRDLVLRTVEELIELEDFDGAEDLLRILVEYMPEDEEPVAMLITVLERSGKKTEAVRIRTNPATEGIEPV